MIAVLNLEEFYDDDGIHTTQIEIQQSVENELDMIDSCDELEHSEADAESDPVIEVSIYTAINHIYIILTDREMKTYLILIALMKTLVKK